MERNACRSSLFAAKVAVEKVVLIMVTMKFKKVRANKSFTSGTKAGEIFTSLSKKETTSAQGRNSTATMAILAYMVELKYLLALS